MNTLTRYRIIFSLVFITLFLFVSGLVFKSNLSLYLSGFTLGLLILSIRDAIQTKHTVLRNYPLIGRLRWFFEEERGKIQQYFIEHDTNGTPYNREKRSDVYQKAKKELNTTPFGTQLDVYEKGYEFIAHSMYPKDIKDVEYPRITVGSSLCKKPYSASIFNISAMSFGALSDNAIKSLNAGAKLGEFYHNTGEGGVSPHHLQGGDLVYQIGTGYFGCGLTLNGKRFFDDDKFLETLKKSESNIKMIEVKLSQGAKPGHGGILPASKNTPEIAEIRGIEPYSDVMSPPYHTAFDSPLKMIDFIAHLRELSNGLPIGIKLCVGSEIELFTLISFMKDTGVYPDFITIDGGEGGTGAAPLVFTNSVGMPLVDALICTDRILKDFDLRNEIKIIASGKASSSFDIVKLLALGADAVNGARAFMLSLGCIQARQCNQNTCPVGIATQDRILVNGLDPAEKRVRVYNYHKAVIHEVMELVGAIGITSVEELTPSHIIKRSEDGKLKSIV